jgi:nitrate/nitrite-specific signal transduction histidine kinase
MGLRVMQYRAGLLRARLLVKRRPGGGTRVCCVAPMLRRDHQEQTR